MNKYRVELTVNSAFASNIKARTRPEAIRIAREKAMLLLNEKQLVVTELELIEENIELSNENKAK